VGAGREGLMEGGASGCSLLAENEPRPPIPLRLRGDSWLERYLTFVQFTSSQRAQSHPRGDNRRRNPETSVRRRVTLHYVGAFWRVHSNVPLVATIFEGLQLPQPVPVNLAEGTGQEGEPRAAEPVGTLQNGAG
jgi:hypothetical protein